MGLGGGWFLDSLLNCVRDGRDVWLKGKAGDRACGLSIYDKHETTIQELSWYEVCG